MAEKRKAGEDAAPGKKQKFDENDIDYLIGDLLKEEAQLVLTRLLRVPDLEAEIRKAIEIVRHSRTKLTEQQIKQQLVQFEQLRALQQAAMGAFDFSGGFSGAGGAFPGFGGRGPAKPGVDPTILKSIRAKVRDSFKKSSLTNRRGDYYTVDEAIVQGELSNAMEKADNGNLRAALDILQGITEEFVERSAHFGESFVDNFDQVLERIGKAWIEAFLCGDIEAESELSPDERDVWAEKLRSWNKSPEEESILNAARWAGKLGWQDAKLRQMLKGESTLDEKVEFKEPKRLTQERLLVLERGKHLNEALNLAKGLGLSYQEARFLMKMNQPKEAVTAALRLIVASEVAAIAQVARPIDLESAFTLGIYCLSLQDQSKTTEMTNWLCDLAIAENKLDELVQRVSEKVKNKNTQFQINTTLKAKGHIKPALTLGYHTLKPYTFDELVALWREYHPVPTSTDIFGGVVLVPTTRNELINSTPGTDVPVALCTYLWDIAYECDQTQSQPSDWAEKTLDMCLKYVDKVPQLFALMQNLEAKSQTTQVQRVAKEIIEKVIQQEKVDLEFKRENTIARIKYEQEKVIAEARGENVAPFVPKPVDHAQYNFEESKGTACRRMLQSLLTNKARLMSLSDPQLAAAAKMTEADIAAKMAECDKQLAEVADLAIGKIKDPSDLIQIAKDMVHQAEYRLSLKIGQKAFAQVQALDKEREPREAILQEYGQLKSENDILLSQKLPLSPEKAERLKELYTKVELNNLLPKYARGGVRDYAQLYQQIATLNIETAISSQGALILNQRLTPQEVANIVDQSLAFVKNPTNASAVVKICSDNKEFALVQKVGKLALEKITELRARLVQRLFIKTELELLQTEQNELRAQKKELEQEQATRLEELQETMKELTPYFYELSTCDAYDNLQYSTLESMMVSASQEVSHLNNLLQSFPPETPAEKIAKTTQDRNEAEKRLPQVFDECIAAISSPARARLFATSLQRLGQFDLTVKACEHGHNLIPPLYDQSLQRWDVRRDHSTLTQELAELVNQKPPQQPPKEKVDSHRQLSLQLALWDTEPAFQNETPHQLEEHTFHLAATMVKCLQHLLSKKLNRLEEVATSLLTPGPIAGNPGVTDAMLAAHEVIVRSLKEEKAAIEQELPKIVAQRRKAVEHCLTTITSNPKHLQSFNNEIVLSDQDGVDLRLAAAKQTFLLIEKMNDQRIAHSPILEKIELLSNEAELLDKYRKKLSDAQAAEFAALGREDDRWNFAATRLKALELSDLNREVARETLQQLQACKFTLENRIAQIAANDALKEIPAELRTPQTDSAALEARLQKVKLAIDTFLGDSLKYVKSPYDINVLCGLFPVDIDQLYRLVRTGFDNTTELNALYEERSPLYQELRKLEAASEELAAVNKQLKKADQDRLEELRHQRFVFDQEYPYRRVRPETREGFKYKMLFALEQALVTVKEGIERRLDAAEDQQKTREAQGLMQVDGEEDLATVIENLNTELEQLDGKFETFIQEFAKELKDPQHFNDLASQLLTNCEYELVIKVGKMGHVLMLELDAQRQKHAELYKSYFLLQQELYTEKNKNSLLHPTRMEKLKELEAQVAAVVPLKYGVSGVSGGGNYGSSKRGGNKGGKSSGATTYPTPEDLAVAAQLTESKDVKFNDFPTDWSAGLNHNHLENLIGQVSLSMLSAMTKEKADFLEELLEMEQSGARDPEKGDTPEIKEKRDKIEKKLLDITNYTMNVSKDYNNNLRLFSHAQTHQENNLLLLLGAKILEQVEHCRQEFLKNQEPARELQKLYNEQTKLVSQRSALPEPEQLRLLELQFQQNLRSVAPYYLQHNLAQYHNTVNDTTNTMWNVVYGSKGAKEKALNDTFNAPRLMRGASLTEDQIREKTQKELAVFEGDIDRVLVLSCKFVTELSHIHNMTRSLNSRFKDFKRVLVLGARAQELLKTQLEIQDKYDALQKKKLELEAKQIAGAPLSEELLEVIADLEELQPKLNYGSGQLRNWILDVAEFMIDAARLEKRDQIVLEQIILVFKMKMTPDKFEEVKNLTDPKNWPTVRKELLDYVVKHDTTLPGSPIDLKTQLELLLKEGLCTESIELFPDPDQNDYLNASRIEILELLWFEVERQKPKELDKILPIIDKYAKKEYQKGNISSLDRLYDNVQQKHADFVKVMYSKGSEILISNLPATKYNLFVDYLKVLKKRLTVDLQVPKEWDTFIAGIRKEHKAKKKLMQLLNVAEL